MIGKRFLKYSVLAVAILLLFGAVSCKPTEKKTEPRSRSFYEYFDTVSVIYSYAGDGEDEFEDNCRVADELLKKYHKYFDIYYQYSGVNNLKTLNDNAGVSPVELDRELLEFLLYAKEMYLLTGGEMNIAMGAVTSLWHDCREEAADDPAAARVPSREELDAAKAHTSIDALVIDLEGGTAYITDPQTSLDVGAIGKGYATEKCAELLIERGVDAYVLNIGGNIRIIGDKPDGKGWITGIQNPDKSSDESFVARIDIKDTSCVTSGSYERYYTVSGKNYHHVIDKDTLYPSEHFSSVTVICKDSALADVLSTTLFCMSYDDGLSLISRIGGVDALWVSTDGEIKMTDGMRALTVEF